MRSRVSEKRKLFAGPAAHAILLLGLSFVPATVCCQEPLALLYMPAFEIHAVGGDQGRLFKGPEEPNLVAANMALMQDRLTYEGRRIRLESLTAQEFSKWDFLTWFDRSTYEQKFTLGQWRESYEDRGQHRGLDGVVGYWLEVRPDTALIKAYLFLSRHEILVAGVPVHFSFSPRLLLGSSIGSLEEAQEQHLEVIVKGIQDLLEAVRSPGDVPAPTP